jgi:hypothetical protein
MKMRYMRQIDHSRKRMWRRILIISRAILDQGILIFWLSCPTHSSNILLPLSLTVSCPSNLFFFPLPPPSSYFNTGGSPKRTSTWRQ